MATFFGNNFLSNTRKDVRVWTDKEIHVMDYHSMDYAQEECTTDACNNLETQISK